MELRFGDLTLEVVDAIVNAANSSLLHGGGVAGAIVRRGGEVIQKESLEWIQKHGPVTHAAPAYTTSGTLPCRYVIHAVGPIGGEPEGDAKLGAAIEGSLVLAEKLSLSSIAFPAISTGIFGFPVDKAAQIFQMSFWHHFHDKAKSSLTDVKIVLFDERTLDIFKCAFDTVGDS